MRLEADEKGRRGYELYDGGDILMLIAEVRSEGKKD